MTAGHKESADGIPIGSENCLRTFEKITKNVLTSVNLTTDTSNLPNKRVYFLKILIVKFSIYG